MKTQQKEFLEQSPKDIIEYHINSLESFKKSFESDELRKFNENVVDYDEKIKSIINSTQIKIDEFKNFYKEIE